MIIQDETCDILLENDGQVLASSLSVVGSRQIFLVSVTENKPCPDRCRMNFFDCLRAHTILRRGIKRLFF